MITPFEIKAINIEHDAWIDMFKSICEAFNLTEKELNDIKFRKIFVMIERWSYYDRARREALKQSEDYKPEWEFGIFWDGDKEEP